MFLQRYTLHKNNNIFSIIPSENMKNMTLRLWDIWEKSKSAHFKNAQSTWTCFHMLRSLEYTVGCCSKHERGSLAFIDLRAVLFKQFMQVSNNSCKFQKCKKHMDLVPYALVLCINETVRLKFPNHGRPS